MARRELTSFSSQVYDAWEASAHLPQSTGMDLYRTELSKPNSDIHKTHGGRKNIHTIRVIQDGEKLHLEYGTYLTPKMLAAAALKKAPATVKAKTDVVKAPKKLRDNGPPLPFSKPAVVVRKIDLTVQKKTQ